MKTFRDLGLPLPICQNLSSIGIEHPFPIQSQAIPAVLACKDVLGRGPTGSGKTFTFGLPMLARLASGGSSRPGRPRAVVLVPTRELAAQVSQRLADPAASVGLRVLEVVGGVNIKRNITSLAAPVDLLVATPGRAQDLLNQRILDFSEVEICAVDEADQMADMGFLPQVRKLLRAMPSDGQRLLFSATLDGDINTLVKEFLTDPVTFSTAPAQATVDRMEHFLLHVEDKTARFAVVERIAARAGTTIMFMRTKHAVDRQVKKLRRVGINAAGLHGDKGQGARTRALEGFSDGSVPVLVATDIAARGIDVAAVDLVVHIDPPAEHKAYVHRAGRTARAGAQGTVVTLVLPEQRKDVAALCRAAGINPAEHNVTPDSPILAKITGAKASSGEPLAPFGAPANATGSPKNTSGGRRRPQRRERGAQDDSSRDNSRERGRGRGRADRARHEDKKSGSRTKDARRGDSTHESRADKPAAGAQGRKARTAVTKVRADGTAVGGPRQTKPRRRRRF
ncbi:DEAD/DEAH box helicase [Corynebacterium aquilae]|uniref:DEAD/DEAH box helicase n=1 Tax=Corynebacterium aquilae TaxID=203263 RepID=UPI000952435F|nr:DEAD/DEAH box helicase [Corynebacterium aquilae]